MALGYMWRQYQGLHVPMETSAVAWVGHRVNPAGSSTFASMDNALPQATHNGSSGYGNGSRFSSHVVSALEQSRLGKLQANNAGSAQGSGSETASANSNNVRARFNEALNADAQVYIETAPQNSWPSIGTTDSAWSDATGGAVETSEEYAAQAAAGKPLLPALTVRNRVTAGASNGIRAAALNATDTLANQ
eukprot:jgi/Chrzof1/12035/Cz06g18260.t1